ncbi:MAG: hypothetical protein ACR2LF_07865 [Jatrophihabitantaceae bacterium]
MGRHSAADEDDGAAPASAPAAALIAPGRHHSATDEREDGVGGTAASRAAPAGAVPAVPVAAGAGRQVRPAPRAAPHPVPSAAQAPAGAPEAAAQAPAEAAPSESAPSETVLSETVLSDAAAPDAVRASQPAREPHGTSADLALLRARPALRAQCAAALLVPVLIYTAVLFALGRTDVYLVWIWIPIVTAGVLVGAFLDAAHKKDRQQADSA